MHLVPEPNNYGKVKVLLFDILKKRKISDILNEFYRNKFYKSREKQFSLSNVVESKQQEIGTKKFKFDWEGGLSEIKDKFTSIQLQHKALEWR